MLRLLASFDALNIDLSLFCHLGEKFISVGLCLEAVSAYEKAGDPKAAIDACVVLNQVGEPSTFYDQAHDLSTRTCVLIRDHQWDQAVKLAERHKFPEIEGLLAKYASHLLQKNKLFNAVELYRRVCIVDIFINMRLSAGV